MSTLPTPVAVRVVVTGSLARLGAEGTSLAIVVLSLERTGSVATAGVLLACSTLPQLVTGPLAGTVLDSTRRPGLVLGTAIAVTALAVVGLAADTALGVGSVALALVLSASEPYLTGGLSAAFARLAPGPLEVPRIASWDAVAYNVAGLGGPALVTVVTAWAGATTATVVLAAGVALALPARPWRRGARSRDGASAAPPGRRGRWA